jgi:hypothetical protein
MNCKWLPEGDNIVRARGEWRGGVYIVEVLHTLLDKTKCHSWDI